jgi:hypothetical protein
VELKAGSRWKSAVCDTEVVVVRPPGGDVELRCGGAAMVAIDADKPSGVALDAAQAGGTAVGKRYVEEAAGIEVLCTKAGAGSLAVGGSALTVKGAKPLPSSD